MIFQKDISLFIFRATGVFLLFFALFLSNDASALTLTVQVSENRSLISTTTGQFVLDSGSIGIQLSGSGILDMSHAIALASSGIITIGGTERNFTNFTSGDLSGIDMTAVKNIGGVSVTAEKAAKILSGISGQSFTFTHADLSNFIVTFPDATTILAPSGWNGTIAPPKTGSSAGTAPSGFSIGSTVIEVGSSNIVLLFDKPIAVILAGVTGSVGYKPSGSSSWTKITSTCGGTYASPAAPTFPGECSISNGSNTKIYTYHFTTFAGLSVVSEEPAPTPAPASSGGGGGGGGSGSAPNIPAQTGVTFSGRAYPKSAITLLKDAQIAATTIAGTDANFSISVSGISVGNYIFSLYSEDNKGIRSSLLTFPVSVTSGATAKVGGIFIAPTIAVDKSEVRRGDNIAIFGQSAPNSEITISVNSDEEFFNKVKTDQSGAYLYNFDTSSLAMEQHFARSKSTYSDEISSFSKSVSFIVGTKNIAAELPKVAAKGDLNSDKRVNLVDFSISAYWYKRPNPPATADLNGDGKVDLIDFSIMAYYWTG